MLPSSRRSLRFAVAVAVFAISGSVAAQNLIQGAEVTLSPFATGSNAVSATPVNLSATANDQQGPGSPIGMRQANGEANNFTGVLRASAGFVGVCCDFLPSAAAQSAIGGIVTPIAPNSVPVGTVELATFSFEFHGSFDPIGNHEIDTLGGSLQVIRVFDSVEVPFWTPPYGILRPSLTFRGDATTANADANTGGNPAYERAEVIDATPDDLRARVYFTIPFVVGESFRVTAQLSAASQLDPSFVESAGSIGAVIAEHTGVLSITLPDGFSLQSPDGLLSQAAVPELGTAGLFSAGLVVIGLGVVRTRRRLVERLTDLASV